MGFNGVQVFVECLAVQNFRAAFDNLKAITQHDAGFDTALAQLVAARLPQVLPSEELLLFLNEYLKVDALAKDANFQSALNQYLKNNAAAIYVVQQMQQSGRTLSLRLHARSVTVQPEALPMRLYDLYGNFVQRLHAIATTDEAAKFFANNLLSNMHRFVYHPYCDVASKIMVIEELMQLEITDFYRMIHFFHSLCLFFLNQTMSLSTDAIKKCLMFHLEILRKGENLSSTEMFTAVIGALSFNTQDFYLHKIMIISGFIRQESEDYSTAIDEVLHCLALFLQNEKPLELFSEQLQKLCAMIKKNKWQFVHEIVRQRCNLIAYSEYLIIVGIRFWYAKNLQEALQNLLSALIIQPNIVVLRNWIIDQLPNFFVMLNGQKLGGTLKIQKPFADICNNFLQCMQIDGFIQKDFQTDLLRKLRVLTASDTSIAASRSVDTMFMVDSVVQQDRKLSPQAEGDEPMVPELTLPEVRYAPNNNLGV